MNKDVMSLGGKRRIHSKHFSAPHMPEDCVDLMQQVTPFVSYEEVRSVIEQNTSQFS